MLSLCFSKWLKIGCFWKDHQFSHNIFTLIRCFHPHKCPPPPFREKNHVTPPNMHWIPAYVTRIWISWVYWWILCRNQCKFPWYYQQERNLVQISMTLPARAQLCTQVTLKMMEWMKFMTFLWCIWSKTDHFMTNWGTNMIEHVCI